MFPIRRIAALLLVAALVCSCAAPQGQAGAGPAVPGSPGAPPQTGGRY